VQEGGPAAFGVAPPGQTSAALTPSKTIETPSTMNPFCRMSLTNYSRGTNNALMASDRDFFRGMEHVDIEARSGGRQDLDVLRGFEIVPLPPSIVALFLAGGCLAVCRRWFALGIGRR